MPQWGLLLYIKFKLNAEMLRKNKSNRKANKAKIIHIHRKGNKGPAGPKEIPCTNSAMQPTKVQKKQRLRCIKQKQAHQAIISVLKDETNSAKRAQSKQVHGLLVCKDDLNTPEANLK